MKRFTVTRALPGVAPEIVDADYFKVEQGALTFRCFDRNHTNAGYPVAVHVFAPGVWAEVELFHAD